MSVPLTVLVSKGRSDNPKKRELEDSLAEVLSEEHGLRVFLVPNLYDLPPDGEAMEILRAISSDIVVVSWIFPRPAHWVLDRCGIRGQIGETLLGPEADDFDEEEDADESEDVERVLDSRPLPDRRIYCLDLRDRKEIAPFVDEVLRINDEAKSTFAPNGNGQQALDLMQWIQGQPNAQQLERYLDPSAGVPRLNVDPSRRWYPVIDYSRCTNCLECIDFCLFGVYGTDRQDVIFVEGQDNCRKGCPACSRVCPENAIIFPHHKTPAIAGSDADGAAGLKIDLSLLFGGDNGRSAEEQAAMERDEQLVAVGREAVGMSVGMPKRQKDAPTAPKDELDKLMDQLDEIEL
ncbi:MAG: ferredoxin family protein [Pirellulales bacterium]|nr:ferredoxin family protein [Pirellulales bacterium]